MPIDDPTGFDFEYENENEGACFEDPPLSESDFDIESPIEHVPFEQRDSYTRLALVPGVGPRTIAALIAHFGSPAEVLQATLSQLNQVSRIGPKMASLIRDAKSSDLCDRVLEHCEQQNVHLLLPGDSNFPKWLMELRDPPPLLFLKGSLLEEDSIAIAMVGTRHCTYYGKTMAERISKSLARKGITIVSGLARGIDAVCHRSALDVGGRTIAVLGSSVTEIYPPEHTQLALDVTQQGALISETHPFAKPKAGVFPQRNRIISGLSLGVVVVEAADRSGSLITARHAGDQGRDVFAVPGPVTSRTSRGCNQLIRDGAILVQDADEIIDHLGPLSVNVRSKEGNIVSHPAELQLNEIEQKVLQCIDAQPTDIDTVVHRTQLPVPRVLSTVSVLEMKGLVRRPSGRTVCR